MYISIYLSFYLSIYLSIYLYHYASTYIYIIVYLYALIQIFNKRFWLLYHPGSFDSYLKVWLLCEHCTATKDKKSGQYWWNDWVSGQYRSNLATFQN